MAYNTGDFLSDAYTGYSSTTPATSALGGLANTAGMYGMLAAPLIGGLFGMPENNTTQRSLAYNQQRGIDTPQEVTDGINSFTSNLASKYGDNYIQNKMPPMSPYDAEVQAMQQSGVGDQEYEMEQINQMFNSGSGVKMMQDYYAANPDWYTPEGDRIYKMQEDVDAMNYMAQSPAWQMNESINPLTEAQKTGAAANGLDPNGMLDMAALQSQFGNQSQTGAQTALNGTGQNYGPSVAPQASQQAVARTGNIYGEGVPRQTYNGKDLYKDQKLFGGNKYKGY